MKNITLISLILLLNSTLFAQTNIVQHNLFVKINPNTAEISVIDSISFQENSVYQFLLNTNFTPKSLSPNIKLKKVVDKVKATDIGMDRDADKTKDNIKLSKWETNTKCQKLIVSYTGFISSQMQKSKDNYQRGFSQTSGIISTKGTYLAGSTYWAPSFENSLVTFKLECELPKNWKNVSQGQRTQNKIDKNKHIDTWICDKPQEEIFLISAPFTEYSYNMASGIKAMAFLRTPDETLANKYLEVTEQYMEMYQSILGKYPYSKFALVENFWETGYGMPSFTLLGEKIIRFPFILHSSYPHELLHNWWGNSVYVDFSKGNWCEGTTAFMADHLIKEQREAGEEYRRSTLQKYSNFVTNKNDFPLNKFQSRYDGPSEAIGYGKALMVWQMLRRKLGDEIFLKGFRYFYKNYQYKTASYDDIRKSMKTVSNLNLKDFFQQWINRTGAPELNIKSIKTDMFNKEYRIFLELEQIQKSDVFNIDIPINIATKKGIESFVFNMNHKEQLFQINLKNKPLKLGVDAQYDVFRILNPKEVPPTLSKIWGSAKNIIILPSKASKKQLAIYKKFAKQWKEADNDHFEILIDKDLKTLSNEKSNWILGYENKFSTNIQNQLKSYHSKFTKDSLFLDGQKISKKNTDLVFTLFNTKDINKQNIFIAIDNEKAIEGLIRKLPHYGKYSFLAFNGDEPTNIAKGQWPINNSPLIKVLDKNGEKLSLIQKRKALAQLKPFFSEKRMMASIKFLSSDKMKGRGLGTPELDTVAQYIANQFQQAGLKPLFKNSYYQKFTHKFKDKGILKLTNVVGIIPGTDKNIKDNPVVVSAHYDHLGFGWPDVHSGDNGKIHHGADDNASGIATIIELAKNIAKSGKSKRTIIFLACSGEEAGLIGSRYFVEHRKEYIKGEIFANINIDTDGSLFNKKILVLNANTAKEWKFIFMGTDYTTGIKSQVVEKQLDASDQVAFIEKNIPAIQLFTGATENYHRPSDTFEKIDGAGLVKVATVAKEVITYLADREDAMPFTGKNNITSSKTPNSTTKQKKIRKVSTGSVPDFTYEGEGVKIGAIIPHSAGEKAGLKVNDIIIEIDGVKTPDLKTYSDQLKKFNAGDTIDLKILRTGKEKNIKIKLSER